MFFAGCLMILLKPSGMTRGEATIDGSGPSGEVQRDLAGAR
jgi:hypothetical protein